MLTSIDLRGNIFSLAGCKALVSGLSNHMARGPCPLKELCLYQCSIGDEGARALANVFVQVEHLSLHSNGLGVGFCQALVGAAKVGTRHVALREVVLYGNNAIGNDGLEYLAPILVNTLENIWLVDCGIGDKGCRALATAAEEWTHTRDGHTALEKISGQICRVVTSICRVTSSKSTLKTVALYDNITMTENALLYLCKFLKRCPGIESVILDERLRATKRTKTRLE